MRVMALGGLTGQFAARNGLLTVLVGLLLVNPVSAQATPQIESIQIGLPGGGSQENGRFRAGSWTPVYIKVKAGKDGNPRDLYRLHLQGVDTEEIAYTYSVSLPALATSQDHLAIGYIRPGGANRDIQVQLKTSDGKVLQTMGRPSRVEGRELVAPQALMALAVGARLNNLRMALDNFKPTPTKPNQPANPVPGKDQPPQGMKIPKDLLNENENDEINEEPGGRRFAYLERVEQLPDRWFGYESVDVVLLVTGNPEFTTQLLQDQTGRCLALMEWVRRGGRLILSVSRNHQLVARLLEEKLPLLECPLKGTVLIPQLNNLQSWVGGEGVLKNIEMAHFEPGSRVHVLLREQGGNKSQPVMVQGAFGLGRVIFVGMDLDTAPFTTWNEGSRRIFWNKLLEDVLQQPLKEFQAEVEGAGQGNLPGATGIASNNLMSGLQRNLETFDELPVINFAWVTLFILLYILIVGPLDYFILKRFIKRLELTWITFPLIVLLVSGLAYWIAYRSKGKDLHTNKIDLVEFDLESGQVLGTSWFTVFSPRVQRYDLANQPAVPTWAAPADPDQAQGWGTMLATMTPGDAMQHLNPPGLFPQPYNYTDSATAIENLAIPVWSTRSFVSSWRRAISSAVPGIEAHIDRGRGKRSLPRGNIVNHLPVNLTNVTLLYGGRAYLLGDLMAGEDRMIDSLFDDPKKERERSDWLGAGDLPRPNASPSGSSRLSVREALSFGLMKKILFNGEGNQRGRNGGLRNLDQTWRIRPQLEIPSSSQVNYRPEIILVGRVASQWGTASELNVDPSSATQLWLGEIAGKEGPPPLPGLLGTDVTVRVYIPVK